MGEASAETFSGVWAYFMSNSSAHGLPNVQRAKSMLAKTIWSLLFLGSVSALLIQIVALSSKYLEYGYTVSLDVKFDRSLHFPAVTICNNNPVLLSKLTNASDDFRGNFDINFDPPPTPPPTVTGGPGGNGQQTHATSTGPGSTTTKSLKEWSDREKGDKFFRDQDESYLKEQKLIAALANLTDEDRKDMGHSLSTMLLDCKWRGYPCSPSNFTSFSHYKYGNCYTFNNFTKRDLTTDRPGPLYGLSMRLFVEQHEYMPEITESAGFRLVVHDRNTMPFPEDDGIAISPGFQTAVTVHIMSIERLGDPYSNCNDHPIKDNIFKKTYDVSYSLKVCERSCYQRKVIDKCKCFDPHYPNSPENAVYPCYVDEEDCLKVVEDQYKTDDVNCNCYQPCNETTYLTSISSAVWPADKYENKLFRDINDRNEEVRSNLQNVNLRRGWVKKNIAKVEVFFQEFNYEYIKQSPAYAPLDLLSDVGGQLGLWLGLSVLTVFEFVEQCGLLVRVCLTKMGRRRKTTSVTPVKTIKILPVDDRAGAALEQL